MSNIDVRQAKIVTFNLFYQKMKMVINFFKKYSSMNGVEISDDFFKLLCVNDRV